MATFSYAKGRILGITIELFLKEGAVTGLGKRKSCPRTLASPLVYVSRFSLLERL